ncbi:MAG: hypothetical protein QY307_10185 [Acidimicrobiia bacterium]|nr:MAG: hypothetical protein QY307_10185 [Acidimicrobiia bacterium]
MSRRKGSRERPRAEQRQYREKFTGGGRRTRPVPAASPARTDPGEPITRARRWAAALLATVVLIGAFVAVVMAIIAQDEGREEAATRATAVAAGLVPVALAVLAMVSRTPKPMRRVLLATPLSIAGFAGLATLLREPATALVFSFGVAGAFLLRADAGHRVTLRISMVSLAAAATLLLAVLVPEAAVLLAPLLPFPASVAADILAESRRAA